MSGVRDRLTRVILIVGLATMGVLVVPVSAWPAPVVNGFKFDAHLGWNVDQTQVERAGATQQEKNICIVSSGDTCQFARESNGPPGGFFIPESAAVASNGDVYVVDSINQRVQVLDPQGHFLYMFGGSVNKTTGTAHPNLCLAAEAAECQAGTLGSGSGQLSYPESIAVDQATGNVYVLNEGGFALDEYTANGEFVLRIGRNVNKTVGTTHPNLCLAAEAAACGAGEPSAAKSTEPGAFKPRGFGAPVTDGGLLAVGGPSGLVYVGDEARVQRFEANGTYAGEISLAGLSSTGKTVSLAVDASGDVFVADEGVAGIHEYNSAGQLQALVIDPSSTAINGLAFDAFGDLGVIDGKRGALYSPVGAKLGEFVPPSGSLRGPTALAFASGSDDLYIAEPEGNEVETYTATAVAFAKTGSLTSLTAQGATFNGEINPNEVGGTKVFVQYGKSETLGSSTPPQPLATGSQYVHVEVPSALAPNQQYYYRVAAEDSNDQAPEQPASGETLSFATPSLPPSIEGAPAAQFIQSETAVLFDQINPENASTNFHFQYLTQAEFEKTGWANATSTPAAHSAIYGSTGLTQELVGLTPATTYRARMVAENETRLGAHEASTGPEATFTTLPSVTPQAVTGAASAVTATGATVSATVDPDGKPAAYAFELGVYDPAGTRFGIVQSASAGEGTTMVGEEVQLTGLQPGTTYAYRIKIESGYGAQTGATATFTTAGLPAVLTTPTVLPQLPIPNIAIPAEVASNAKPQPRTSAHKPKPRSTRCAKQRGRRQRAACERNARKRQTKRARKRRR